MIRVVLQEYHRMPVMGEINQNHVKEFKLSNVSLSYTAYTPPKLVEMTEGGRFYCEGVQCSYYKICVADEKVWEAMNQPSSIQFPYHLTSRHQGRCAHFKDHLAALTNE